MLLIIAAVFLLKRNTHAIPLPSPPPFSTSHTPIFTQDDSSTSDGGQRTVLDILWSCLATTFACTWISVHPNVPWKGEGKWTILGRRIYLMFFSILAPEFMVMWAYKQWRGARMIKEVVNDSMRDAYSDPGEKQPRLWTAAHGHLLQMGGFKLYATEHENYYWGGFKVLGNRVSAPRDIDGEESSDALSFLKRFKHNFGPDFLPRHRRCLISFEELNSVNNGHGADSSTKDEIREGVLRIDALRQLLAEGLADLPAITEDEIDDRSKGDALSKGIALVQLTWFVVQIITRAAQGLAISELELTTAALAGMNSAMYFFWWSKPRDVRFPVAVRTKRVEKLLADRLVDDVKWRFSDAEFSFRKHLCAALRRAAATVCSSTVSLPFGIIAIFLKLIQRIKTIPQNTRIFLSSIVKFAKSPPGTRHVSPVVLPVMENLQTPAKDPNEHASERQLAHRLKRVALSAIDYAASPFFLLIYLVDLALVVPIGQILGDQYNQSLSDGLNSRLAVASKHDTFRMMFCSEYAREKPLLSTASVAGALFGAVHCLAWHFGFPTRAEEIMWRAASLGVAGSCVLSLVGVVAYDVADRNVDDGEKLEYILNYVLRKAFAFLLVFLPLVYPISRILLLIIAVTSLRSLPSSAFDTVDWIELLPHI